MNEITNNLDNINEESVKDKRGENDIILEDNTAVEVSTYMYYYD